jgi:putative RNA 2'-phosphotransferase
MGLDLIELSRAVSHALRHEPWLYELELDEQGWAEVEDVVNALRVGRAEWSSLCEADLVQMLAASSKLRHEISNGRIRALYGHSLPGKLKMSSAPPPDELYHGTAPATVPSVRKAGLLPMGRQYVHLSVDTATAFQVGKRKSNEPVILRIAAAEAHATGVRFYEGSERVWLADQVPSQFIIFDA